MGGLRKPPQRGLKSVVRNTNLKLMLPIQAQLTPLYKRGARGDFIATVLKSP
jgi:hypothetical protein